MEKLMVVIMGQNCKKFIGMCLESVKDADAIVYCDGGSTDGTKDKVLMYHHLHVNEGFDLMPDIIENPYDQEDKAMNGKQRNFYLDYIKNHYSDYWCLAIDADEVVEDLGKIKEYIQHPYADINSIRMRHFVGDLGHEDATKEKHYVLHRLFRISSVKNYPEVEHPVLIPNDDYAVRETDCTTIWHLSYIPNMWDLKKKYDNHMAKSNMHSSEYLNNWYKAHLFGVFPRKQVCSDDIPSIILKEFGIDSEELYFQDRKTLLAKHFVFVKQWNEFFKPKSVCDFGCGTGLFLYCWEITDAICQGYELSNAAIKIKSCNSDIKQFDLNKDRYSSSERFELVTAIDVLEHLQYDKIDDAIDTLISASDKHILTSIPYKGTPNCDIDKTHVIKESKDWWIDKFTKKGVKLIPVPEHFIFREQILIFKK